MPKGKRHSAEFKVALEAAKGTKTLNELASEYGLHPSQISEWKGRLVSEGASIFSAQQIEDIGLEEIRERQRKIGGAICHSAQL